jgi:prolyl-tRNA synthetase
MLKAGVEVLLDDRSVSGGVKLKDADLVGFPVRILVSEKTVQKDSVELKLRTESTPTLVKRSEAVSTVTKLLDRPPLSA